MLQLNRRAVSLIISYVLLISIAMALSVTVYAWLRFYVNPGEVAECPGNIKLIIKDYDCTAGGFNLTVKNKGTHTVDGFRVAVNKRQDAEFAVNIVDSINHSIGPGEEYNEVYPSDGPVGLIEVNPYVIEGSEKIYCDNAVARQKVDC